MEKIIVPVLAGLFHNAKAVNHFSDRDYDKRIFYEHSEKAGMRHGEKEAFFLAHCALTFYSKYAELAPWSYIYKILTKKKSPAEKVAAYKKVWRGLLKKKRIKFGAWSEHLNTLIGKYREYRHKDIFWQSAALHELSCLGSHGQLTDCKGCAYWAECKKFKHDDQSDHQTWVLDWSCAEIEQVKLDTRATHVKVYSAGALLKKSLDRLDKERKEVDEDGNPLKCGIPTPFPILTKNIGGWMQERLYCVASRSGVGKSAFLLQCANHAASLGHPVIYINLEMPVENELIWRVMAYLCNVDFDKLMKRDVDDKLFAQIKKRVYEWLDSVSDNPLYYLVDMPNSAKVPAILRQIDRFLAYVGRTDVLAVIDYFNIISIPNDGRKEYTHWANNSKLIHNFMRDRHIAGLTALQLNRVADGVKRLTAKHIRDADAIMDHLDGLWGLATLSDELLRFQPMKHRYFTPVEFFLKKELWQMRFVQHGEGKPSIPVEESEDGEEFFSG